MGGFVTNVGVLPNIARETVADVGWLPTSSLGPTRWMGSTQVAFIVCHS